MRKAAKKAVRSTVRTARKAARSAPKPFLILNGRMENGFNPQSPTELPENPWLQDGGIIGEFATLEAAVAEAVHQNQVFLDCNLSDEAWSMVVVRLDCGKAVPQ